MEGWFLFSLYTNKLSTIYFYFYFLSLHTDWPDVVLAYIITYYVMQMLCKDSIIKFAGYTTVIGLITDGEEGAFRE